MNTPYKFRVVAAIAASWVVIANAASTGTFNEASSMKGLEGVDSCPGVYVIYKDGSPYYAGRSRVNVYNRLRAHISGRGSRMVADQLGQNHKLEWWYQCTDSPEQAEAQLISLLGTTGAGNLRRETDPADWDDN